MDRNNLVILSGGQDSTTCLGLAAEIEGLESVAAIAFNYGQKHEVELDCARHICKKLGVPLKVVDITFFGEMVSSALLSEEDVSQPHSRIKEVPASFVPNRNAMFITIAHAYAQEIGAKRLYTGVCQTDYSGYPDCRLEFIQSLQDTLNLGYNSSIQIVTPLMFLNKAETFLAARQCGFLDIVINETHTCYNGDHETFHDWGYGCGTCPACELREKGYQQFLKLEEQQ